MALRSRSAGRGFKLPPAALAEDRRGERGGKGVARDVRWDQEDERKRIADDVSLLILGDIRTGAVTRARDKSGGCPLIGQAGSGMEAT